MACRLVNTSGQLIRVDLRDGASLTLAPGQLSEALREELLYENIHVGTWEREGKLRRVPVRFAEIVAQETGLPVATVADAADSAQGEPASASLDADAATEPREAEAVTEAHEAEGVIEPDADEMDKRATAEPGDKKRRKKSKQKEK